MGSKRSLDGVARLFLLLHTESHLYIGRMNVLGELLEFETGGSLCISANTKELYECMNKLLEVTVYFPKQSNEYFIFTEHYAHGYHP